MSFVYLLHFDEPYPAGARPQHYLGVARDLDERIRAHMNGYSRSRLTAACFQRGILMHLAKSWEFMLPEEAFQFERETKAKKKSYSRLCPLCIALKEKASDALR